MNPFKKFCISFVVLTALYLLIIYPALFFSNLGIEDSPGRIMDDWFKIKEGYAKAHAGRKLFVFGCSETLYGVDSPMMESELDLPVVNFGVVASLRKYMFGRIRYSLTSGDIVLLPIAYHVYQDRPLDEATVVYSLEYDPEYFWQATLAYKAEFIYRLKPSFLLKRILARAIGNEEESDDSSLYSKWYVNANGDLIHNTYETRTYVKPGAAARQCLNDKDAPSYEMRYILTEFAKYCRNAHIKLYVTWPPLYPITEKKEFDGHDSEIVNSVAKFWKENNVQVLGNYSEVLFEADDCYDDPNHLNDRAKPQYMKHLIELIRPYI